MLRNRSPTNIFHPATAFNHVSGYQSVFCKQWHKSVGVLHVVLIRFVFWVAQKITTWVLYSWWSGKWNPSFLGLEVVFRLIAHSMAWQFLPTLSTLHVSICPQWDCRKRQHEPKTRSDPKHVIPATILSATALASGRDWTRNIIKTTHQCNKQEKMPVKTWSPIHLYTYNLYTYELPLIGRLSYDNDTKGFELNGCIVAARPAHRCDIILSSAGRSSLIRTHGPLSHFFLTVTTFPVSRLRGKQPSA